MAGLFQPKRVQVPGLLSDEGLSVALKNLSDTTKAGAEAAPPNTSAIEAANQITTEALKPQPTVKTAAPRVPGVELSAGAEPTAAAPTDNRIGFGGTVTGFDVGKAIVQAGTLTPEQGEADRAERAAQAGAEAEVATGELADKTRLLSADEREAIGLPPLTPEDTMRLSSSIAQEQQIVKEKQERAKFIAEGPLPTQTEWLNIAQVSTRSAIQMGVGALRYPADIWDTLGAVAAGTDEVKKSEVSLYLDNVDKALTAMMPGDKTRSKDFTTKLAAGAGSMVGFMVTGWAGRAVGLPAWLTTGTLGAAVEGDSLYQEADTFGATATQKLIALFAGSALGVTEAIPIDRAFMRADVASGGTIRNLLANTTSSSLEEFIQEASQSLGEDIIAKYGAGYDPKREISVDKALENGLIGAITGGVVGGATTLLSNGQPVEHLVQDEAKITETVDAALAEEQSRFASIIGDEAVDGEGALAAPAQGAGGSETAGGEAAAARPDPVVADQPRGDAVQEIVKPTNVPKAADVEAQVSPAQARALTTPVELPTDPVFAQAVAAVPGAEITADGLLIDLVRFQKPEQEGAASVRTGVFYLPKGSSNARHYKTGGQPGQHYGGSVKVEGKTLIKRPLFVKGATGGKAPEAAFVALNGKEAFAKLERDIMHVVGGQSALRRDGLAEEAVYNLLTEYGADGDMAYEIIANSTKGNQLRYALQENIIAHAVRAAGYDAVVGHSKGKSGPFISEVFDVREIDYPVPGSDTATLHPMFEQQVANPVERVQLEPTETAPLPGASTSPDPNVVKAARAYTAAAGLPTRRQRDFVTANPARSNRIAQAYADMKHEPADPAVLSSYQALVEEVQAQYVFASAAGDLPPAENVPVYPPDHPLAAVADQFWALHRFFGQGLEGASDPENMWQAHARLFSADALPAFTAETRGAAAFAEQFGEPAERKVGQLPSWTWQEGVEDTTAYAVSAPVETADPAAFRAALAAAREASKFGVVTPIYTAPKYAKMRTFLSPDGSSGFALDGEKIVSLFGASPTQLRKIADTAIANGGRTFEGFDTGLPEMMASLGFRETGRKPWVDAYAPKDWPADLGKPDMVSMEWSGQPDETVAPSTEMVLDPEAEQIDRMTGTATVRQPYIAEPTRPTRGIPSSPATAALKAEDARLSLISKDFAKLLDLTAKQGRLVSGRDTMGEYHRRSATIRLRTHDDFSTLAHEAGHAIHDSRATEVEAIVQRNLKDIYAASKIYAMDISQEPAVKRQREGFAEFFRVYVTNRRGAEQRWPTLTADFDQMLRKTEPKVAAGLDNIHNRVQMWTNISSKQLIRNMIVDGRREMGLETAYKELRDNGFKTWIEETARRTSLWFTERMINRNVALAELQARLLNQGEEFRGGPLEVPLSELPYQNLRMARNSGSLAQIELTDGVYPYRGVPQPVTRGLRDAMLIAQGYGVNETPLTLDKEREKDFGAYLIARRAWEEWKRFDAGEITRAPIAAQKGEIARTIKEYEASNPEFIKAAEIAHRFAMGLWHKRYEAGLIDKDTYEEVAKRAFYVPLQRDISDKAGAEGAQIQFGSSALTKPGRFRGSDREIISPMTMLMQMTIALEKQISENDAKKFLAVLADRAGAAGALVERIPANQIVGQTYSVQQVVARLLGDVPTEQEIADYMTANNATREQALDNLVKDSHVDPADAADLMSILAGSVEKGDLMTLFKAEQAGTLGENVVFFWENGKVAAMRINDMELAAGVVSTMNAIGRENMDLPLSLIATTSSVFRSAITKWFDFIVNSFVIGEFTNFLLTDTGYIPIYSGLKGIRNELLQKDVAKQYNAARGIMGGMSVSALHRSRVDRDIKALRSKGYIAQAFGDMDNSWDIVGVAKGLGRVTEITESGGRFSVFEGARKRAIADGLNEFDASFEASYIATDLIDFGLNGSSMLTVRRLVPFLNAALQGLYKTARTLGGGEVARRKGVAFALSAYLKNINNLPLSRAEMKELKTGRRLWVWMTLAGMISALITFLQKDDEDYQETSEYLRATTWVFSLGKKNGEVVTIPKPRELAILANLMERGIEWGGGDTTAMAKAIRGAGLAVTPPTSVPLFETIAEVQAGKDFFTGRDIIPKYMRAWAPEQQFDNYTSSLAKWLGGVTGQSPMIVDHIMRGMGASAYRDISNMATAADPSRSTLPATEWPLLRRYYRDVKKGSQATADFWAQASNENGKLGQAAASYKREVDAGTPQSANFRLSKMSADERAYAVLMTHFTPEEQRLNPFYRATQLTSIVSGMRREIETELGIGDSTFKKPTREELLAGAEFSVLPKMTKGVKAEVSSLLSELARREVRNTLIATKQPGWADKKTLPVDETLEQLERVSPDAYDEFQRRRAKAKVYDAEAVYEYWPEVRDRLNSDGPDAFLGDAVAIAGVVF